jgi:protein-tyrosine-phosphatase
MTTILLIGGADTARAPMAAALLRRLLDQQGYDWGVGSAGVLGHDGDPAEIEARETMAHMNLSVDEHLARSLTDDLVGGAALLLAIDNGTALVLRARFPSAAARTHTLGALAGRQRDIPDPFRMQIGAWITYAREIAALLEAALPRIVELMPTTDDRRPTTDDRRPTTDDRRPTTTDDRRAENQNSEPRTPNPEPRTTDDGLGTTGDARRGAAERIERLLRTIADLPGAVDWSVARERIEADLGTVAAAPRDGGDLAAAYVGLLRAALAMTPAAPSPGQSEALCTAAARLHASISQAHLNELSARLAGWSTL